MAIHHNSTEPPSAPTPLIDTPTSRLFDHVRPIVEAFAARLPEVRAALLRRDGRDFLFLGADWSPEMSAAAAELSIALQRAFAPDFSITIEGGYEPERQERPLEGYEVGSSRVDLQACKLEYSIVSPK